MFSVLFILSPLLLLIFHHPTHVMSVLLASTPDCDQGHIGSSDGGFALVEPYGFVPYLVDQAMTSSTLSTRG